MLEKALQPLGYSRKSLEATLPSMYCYGTSSMYFVFWKSPSWWLLKAPLLSWAHQLPPLHHSFELLYLNEHHIPSAFCPSQNLGWGGVTSLFSFPHKGNICFCLGAVFSSCSLLFVQPLLIVCLDYYNRFQIASRLPFATLQKAYSF